MIVHVLTHEYTNLLIGVYRVYMMDNMVMVETIVGPSFLPNRLTFSKGEVPNGNVSPSKKTCGIIEKNNGIVAKRAERVSLTMISEFEGSICWHK